MMLSYFIASLSGFFLFWISACSTPPTYSSGSSDSLVFGKGGGVANTVKSYVLYQDGQLVSFSNLSSDTTALATVAASDAQRIFAQVSDSSFATLNFRHPGNMYYFIRYHGEEVVWGSSEYAPPTKIQQIYDTLQSFVLLKN